MPKFRVVNLVFVVAMIGAMPVARAANISDADRSYLRDDEQGALYEQALAQQAAQKATRDDVRGYASKVASDHTTFNPALEQLGKSKGVDMPKSMTDDDKSRLDSIGKLTGDAYDKQFVTEAIRINSSDKSQSAQEEQRTSDSDIKAFLQKFKSVDEEHEKAALALQK